MMRLVRGMDSTPKLTDEASRGDRSRSAWSSTIAKLGAIFAFFSAWSLLYLALNTRGANPSRAFYFPRPYDLSPHVIQPWTAVIYVFGGLATPFLPFLYNWTWSKLRFVLLVYFISSVLMFVFFFAFPVAMVRPVYTGDGFGERLMRSVFSVDREANCFPSSHTLFAILAAILTAHGGAPRPVRVLMWILAAAICATTITTGQHYFMDVAGGIITAMAGYVAAARVVRPDGLIRAG